MKKKYIAPKTKFASMMLSNILEGSNTLRLGVGRGDGSNDANSNERNFFDDDDEDDEFNW